MHAASEQQAPSGSDHEELRERRGLEAEALTCIYGDAEVVAADDAALAVQVVLDIRSRRVVALVRMVETYPSPADPLSVSFECHPPLDPEAHEVISEELRGLCAELVGRECAYDVLQALEARLGSLVSPGDDDAAEHCAHEQSGAAEPHDAHEDDDDDDDDADDDFGGGARAPNHRACDGGDREVCVIKLDHIRDHKRYLKTVKGWAQELDLSGCVVLSGRLILIVLGGQSEDLSRYLVLHRTTNIDVDSNGRRCKERLLEVVLREPQAEACDGPSSFEVFQPGSPIGVKKALVGTCLLSEKQIREALKVSPVHERGKA